MKEMTRAGTIAPIVTMTLLMKYRVKPDWKTN